MFFGFRGSLTSPFEIKQTWFRFTLDVAIAERCSNGCAHVLDRCIVDCNADSKCVSDCMRTFDACENGNFSYF